MRKNSPFPGGREKQLSGALEYRTFFVDALARAPAGSKRSLGCMKSCPLGLVSDAFYSV